MPEVTPETQTAEDLDQRVESLLKQMETAAQTAAGIVSEAEASEQISLSPSPEPPPAEADLASQVDQLLAEASAEGPAEESPSIGSLDDELAKLASDLIEGEYRDDAPPPPVLASAPASAGPPAPDPAVGDRPVVRHPAAAPPAEPAPAPKPAGPPLWRRAVGACGRVLLAVVRAVRRYAPTFLAWVEPIAFRITALISSPLRQRPALVRDAVGWVALGTAFWASCLLGYFLFLYEPDAPKPTAAAVALNDPSHPEAEHEPEAEHVPQAEHEPEASEHKPEAPAKEAGGHGGGGGAGEKAAAPRVSPLKRSDKSPLGTAPKKAEKKAAGGGH